MIVAKFLSWIETAPVERRAEATSALARAYLYSDLDLSEKEAAETALTIMLDDASPMVRAALAHALASSPFAPRQIVLTLIQDSVEVAVPVVAQSPVLLDGELVDLVAKSGNALQRAVACRPSVSPSLSAAVAEVCGLPACLELLGNPGAQVTKFSLRRLAERFGGEADMRNALLSMPALPVDIRQTLIVQLGDALEQLALVQTFVATERRTSLVKDACDKATVNLAFCCSHGDEMEALVEHLRLSGQLTADILIRALCMGNVEMFVASLVSLTGMSDKRVRECMLDANDSLVSLLCKKAGISLRVTPAILSALNAYYSLSLDLSPDASRTRFARLMVDRILSDYDGVADDEMDDLHALLRRFATQIARDEAREMRAKIQQVQAA